MIKIILVREREGEGVEGEGEEDIIIKAYRGIIETLSSCCCWPT